MITPKTPLSTVLEIGRECDRSGRCCKCGSGIVLEGEVAGLAEKLSITEEEFKERYLRPFENLGTKHYRLKQKKVQGRPHGPCVFLKGNDCSIHEFKPLHCRVTSCCSKQGEALSQWFMINKFLNKNDPESVEEYRKYLERGGKTLPGGQIEELLGEKKQSNKQNKSTKNKSTKKTKEGDRDGTKTKAVRKK